MKNPATYPQSPGILPTPAVSPEPELQENINFTPEINDSDTVINNNQLNKKSEEMPPPAKTLNPTNTQSSTTPATKPRATRQRKVYEQTIFYGTRSRGPPKINKESDDRTVNAILNYFATAAQIRRPTDSIGTLPPPPTH